MAYTQRDADWIIEKAYLHANRKATAPASTTTKYSALLAIVDSMQKMWESEPNVEWSSLYQKVTLAATVTATDTFALSTSINYLSKRQNEFVLLTDGTSTERYKIINPAQLYKYKDDKAVAQIGRNLKFSREFETTDSVFGYSIIVPAITFADDIDTGTDLVQVDDPMWLAYMTAAEFVRNDIVKRSEYDSLLALATQVMDKMKQNNSGGEEVMEMAFQADGADW